MRTLVAFSSGWDSTYILWKLLTDTADEVTAFHMDLSAIEYEDPKWRPGYYADLYLCEQISVPAIIAWLSANVRAVTCQEVPIQTMPIGEWINPMAVRTGISLIAGHDRFIYGACPEMGTVTPGTGTRLEWYRRLWAELAPADKPMEFYLRDINQCRPHAMKFLPVGLQGLVYSCIRPTVVNGQPTNCGTCHKCMVNADVRTQIDAEADPDDVLLDIQEKRGAGQFRGSASTDLRYRQELANYLHVPKPNE